MEIRYRLHRDDDVPKLRQLWRDSSNWGDIADEDWRTHVSEAPLGGPFITVVTDEHDEVLGAMSFLRQRILLNGREVKAVRPFAPIVSETLRKRMRSLNPIDHPVVKMAKHTDAALRAQGIALTYMLPDPHWKLLFRFMPGVQLLSFPLHSLPLPLATPFDLPAGHEAAPFDAWGDDVDHLWTRAAATLGAAVVRDNTRMRTYCGPPRFQVIGVRRHGELVGLASARQHGDRQWLLCDLVAADATATRATLAAACNHAHGVAGAGEPGALVKAALLLTPTLAEAAASLGFVRDQYDFTLALRVIGDAVTREEVTNATWYLSAND